jgi:hypothetical protein
MLLFYVLPKKHDSTKVAYFVEVILPYIISGAYLGGANVIPTLQVVITDCRKIKCMRLVWPPVT